MCARNKKSEKNSETDPDLITKTKNAAASNGTYYFEKTNTYVLSKSLKLEVDSGYKATLYFQYMDPITVTKCPGKSLVKTAKLRNELIGKPFYIIFEYTNLNKRPSEWGFCTDPFKFTDRTFRVGANGHISIEVTDCDKFIKTMFNGEAGIYYTETVYATVIKEFEKMAHPLLVDLFDDVHPFVKSADYLLENYNIELEDFFLKKEPYYFDQFGVRIFLPEFASTPPSPNAPGHLACNVYVNKDCLDNETNRFTAEASAAKTRLENERKQAEIEESKKRRDSAMRLAEETKRLDEEEQRFAEEEQLRKTNEQRLAEEAANREEALRKREESVKRREERLKKRMKDSLSQIENAKKLEEEIRQRIEESQKQESEATKRAEAAKALEAELTRRLEELNKQINSLSSDDGQSISEPTDTDTARNGKKTVKKTVVKRVPKPPADRGEPDSAAEASGESTAKKTVVVKKTIVKKKV